MMELTPVQLQMLRFIAGYQAANGGVSPTFEQCAHAMGGRAKSNAARVIAGLERRGAVARLPHRRQAIKVLRPVSIPSIDGAPLYAVPMVAQAQQTFSGERL